MSGDALVPSDLVAVEIVRLLPVLPETWSPFNVDDAAAVSQSAITLLARAGFIQVRIVLAHIAHHCRRAGEVGGGLRLVNWDEGVRKRAWNLGGMSGFATCRFVDCGLASDGASPSCRARQCLSAVATAAI